MGGVTGVPTWRDGVSARAQADLDGLLDFALGFAQQQLRDRGEFYPYAALVGQDGAPEMVAVRPAVGGEHPKSTHVLDACVASLQARRSTIRAAAIVLDVHVKDLRTDAIEVDLEHTEGAALSVILPYRRERSNQVRYGPMKAQPGPRRVWHRA